MPEGPQCGVGQYPLNRPAVELGDDRLAGLIREMSAHAVQLIVTLHSDSRRFKHRGEESG
jgi:hypothetical protein